jgi:hypothetical protein
MSADASLVLSAINKLSPQYKEAVYLRFVEDLLPQDIAQILHATPNAVSVRINRGLQELRTLLGLYEPLNDPRGVFATTYNSNSFLFIADFGNHRVLCGVETSGIYSVTQVLGENSVGFGVTQASLITYTPSTGSSGSSAVFSFSTTLSGTISTIGVTSASFCNFISGRVF